MFYHCITKYTDILVEKMREAFALQKLFIFFSTKSLGNFQITSCCGTMEQVHLTEGTLNILNFNKKNVFQILALEILRKH